MTPPLLLMILSLGLLGCGAPSAETGNGSDLLPGPPPTSGRAVAWEIHAPVSASLGTLFPIVVRGPEDISGTLPLQLNEKLIPVSIHRGVGSLVHAFDHSLLEISVDSPEGSIQVLANTLPVRTFAGVLTDEDLLWEESASIHITETVTVPLGKILLVGPGTEILLEENVQLEIIGDLTLAGEIDHPVVLTPALQAT